MSNYIIGIDGGGTKTLGVLYDLSGNEIKRYVSGYTNFNIDYKQATLNLFEVLDELSKDIKIDDKLFIQMGISGYSKIEDKPAFEKTLEKKYHATVSIESDVMIALYDVKKDLNVNVIIVIGGTGSVLMYSNQHQLEQLGGFGHLLGDEGSAYHASMTALKDVIKTYEETGSYDDFGNQILEHLNVYNQYGIRDFVYGNDKTAVANIAKFISELALKGYEKAVEILKDEARHLAIQTIQAYKKLADKDKVIIALRGGFITQAPFVKPTFVEEIKPTIKDFEINESNDSPVKGAYYLSLLKLKKG